MMGAPTWLIPVTRIHEAHELAIARWGGLPGLRDQDCPQRSLEASLNAALYASDDDPDPLVVSVNLLYYLARNHCYADGNKRVAWLSFVDQLACVGLGVAATQTEVEALVVAVASGETDTAGVTTWVAQRLMARH